jgi:hypothetical protein
MYRQFNIKKFYVLPTQCVYVVEISNTALICTTQVGSTTDGTTTLQHTGHVTTHYTIHHPFNCVTTQLQLINIIIYYYYFR